MADHAKARKQIHVSLPIATVEQIKKIAKLAGVTPTQVYNVIIAMAVCAHNGKPSAPR